MEREVDPKAFGQRIRARREKLGLTQSDLASETGMSQQGIANFEAGIVRRPRLMKEVARVLETTEEWLLWKEGPEEARPAVDFPEIDEIVAILQSLKGEKRRAAVRFVRNLAKSKVKVA